MPLLSQPFFNAQGTGCQATTAVIRPRDSVGPGRPIPERIQPLAMRGCTANLAKDIGGALPSQGSLLSEEMAAARGQYAV